VCVTLQNGWLFVDHNAIKIRYQCKDKLIHRVCLSPLQEKLLHRTCSPCPSRPILLVATWIMFRYISAEGGTVHRRADMQGDSVPCDVLSVCDTTIDSTTLACANLRFVCSYAWHHHLYGYYTCLTAIEYTLTCKTYASERIAFGSGTYPLVITE
jgi:hypothetical protein